MTALASTPLMTWYDGYNLTGNSTIIYGSAGQCDTAGYSITPNIYWRTAISSIRGANTCNRVMINNNNNPPSSIYGCLPYGALPGSHNNWVSRIQVYQASGCPYA